MQQLQDVVQESGVGFGTSGARGLVSALTPKVCQAYAQAFLWSMQSSFQFKHVAVAIDLRPSSPEIALSIVQTITAMGMIPIYCGAIPTPALALFAQSQAIPAIMVTGSHIPFDRNGLKFYRPDGEISKEDEQRMLSAAIQSLPETLMHALPETNPQAQQAYIARYLSLYPANSLSGFRLGVYQHSSVCRDLLVDLLQQLGAEVTALNRSDAFVPIDTEAVSAEDVERGRVWSNAYHFDAIISTDGDGDRPLIGDEHGQWLRGDVVGLLTAHCLNIDVLAVPVSCNTAIERSGYFQHVTRTRIGSPYVIAAMQALSQQIPTASVAGFEANGGFLLGSDLHLASTKPLTALPTRDAVLPVVAVLNAAKSLGIGLSQLVANLPQRFTASDRIQQFPTETSQQLIAHWSVSPAQCLMDLNIAAKVQQIDTTDGLRMQLDNQQIVHLRPSGNAPELRCYVETAQLAQSQALVHQILTKLANLKPKQ